MPEDLQPSAPAPVAVAAAGPSPEPSVTRFTVRDYTYIKRELRTIAVLAVVIIVAIVVLSFFLP
jgi:hypothetical protein